MDWDPTTHYQKAKVAEEYDRIRFSSLAGRTFNALERRTIGKAFAGIARDRRVVDVPCGTGRLAETLLELGFDVSGVDISAPMLNVAKRRLDRFGDRFSTRVADVAVLAQESPASFDVALCARVLMHFPLEQQIAFLGNVARVARETVILTQSLSTPYQRLRRRVKGMLGNQPPAGYPITNAELASLLEASGLRESRRFRTFAPISEEIIVVAEKRGAAAG
jgi:2-polyprenyl-3-methyl-5-hydroxy-6-metoxy-1,4-benzoquinol methylase